MTSLRFLANERTFNEAIFGRCTARGETRCVCTDRGIRISHTANHLVPVSQESLSFKFNMASLPFVGTLESDDDVDQLDNESDSDEEPEKVYRH